MILMILMILLFTHIHKTRYYQFDTQEIVEIIKNKQFIF